MRPLATRRGRRRSSSVSSRGRQCELAVVGHADGICHVYVDQDADLEMAEQVTINAKTQYVAVCNAMETMLVHENVADKFLPTVYFFN